MNQRLELDIDSISIIAHKNEEPGFKFEAMGRAHDGFVMITRGTGYVTDPKGKKHKISSGDAFITSQGDFYTIESDEEFSYVTSGIILKTDKALLPVIYKCSERQQKNIIELNKVWQSRSWDSYAICRIGLLRFYMEIIKETLERKNVDSDIAKAIEYIHDNFKTNFTGKELSEYCSVSMSYLRARFLKQTGQTIVRYRDSLRIAAAKEMLESKYFTVTEIATELGYCDVYHFSKAFSAYVGMSPTKWVNKAHTS